MCAFVYHLRHRECESFYLQMLTLLNSPPGECAFSTHDMLGSILTDSLFILVFLSIFPRIDGKRKGESGTLTRATLERQGTAVRLDDTPANIQAQAGCWTPTTTSSLPFACGLPWPLGIRAIQGGKGAEAGE